MKWARQNPNATEVRRIGKKITDVGAQALARACPNLTKIWLENTQVTDAGAQAFAHECPNLTWIDLSGTQVTISVWVYLWPMWATGLSFVI